MPVSSQARRWPLRRRPYQFNKAAGDDKKALPTTNLHTNGPEKKIGGGA